MCRSIFASSGSAGDHVADEEGGEWVRIDEQLHGETERTRSGAWRCCVEGRIMHGM